MSDEDVMQDVRDLDYEPSLYTSIDSSMESNQDVRNNLNTALSPSVSMDSDLDSNVDSDIDSNVGDLDPKQFPPMNLDLELKSDGDLDTEQFPHSSINSEMFSNTDSDIKPVVAGTPHQDPAYSPSQTPPPLRFSLAMRDPAIQCACLDGTSRPTKEMVLASASGGLTWMHICKAPARKFSVAAEAKVQEMVQFASKNVGISAESDRAQLRKLLEEVIGPNRTDEERRKIEHYISKYRCDGPCTGSKNLKDWINCKECWSWQHVECMLYGEKGDRGGPVCNHCYMNFLLHQDECIAWQKKRLAQAALEAWGFIRNPANRGREWQLEYARKFLGRVMMGNQKNFAEFVATRRRLQQEVMGTRQTGALPTVHGQSVTVETATGRPVNTIVRANANANSSKRDMAHTWMVEDESDGRPVSFDESVDDKYSISRDAGEDELGKPISFHPPKKEASSTPFATQHRQTTFPTQPPWQANQRDAAVGMSMAMGTEPEVADEDQAQIVALKAAAAAKKAANKGRPEPDKAAGKKHKNESSRDDAHERSGKRHKNDPDERHKKQTQSQIKAASHRRADNRPVRFFGKTKLRPRMNCRCPDGPTDNDYFTCRCGKVQHMACATYRDTSGIPECYFCPNDPNPSVITSRPPRPAGAPSTPSIDTAPAPGPSPKTPASTDITLIPRHPLDPAMCDEVRQLSATFLWHAYCEIPDPNLPSDDDDDDDDAADGLPRSTHPGTPPPAWLRECEARLTLMLEVAGAARTREFLQPVLAAWPRRRDHVVRQIREFAVWVRGRGPLRKCRDALGLLAEVCGLVDKGVFWHGER